jgi:hypothetical protein
MKGFILGTIFGIVICTVGFGGIARMFDPESAKCRKSARKQPNNDILANQIWLLWLTLTLQYQV